MGWWVGRPGGTAIGVPMYPPPPSHAPSQPLNKPFTNRGNRVLYLRVAQQFTGITSAVQANQHRCEQANRISRHQRKGRIIIVHGPDREIVTVSFPRKDWLRVKIRVCAVRTLWRLKPPRNRARPGSTELHVFVEQRRTDLQPLTGPISFEGQNRP